MQATLGRDMTQLPDLQPPVPAPTARFAEALRAAIQASGLSLNRIEHRLRERGQAVSSATLSYWQSGLRQPSRHDSLLVVRALEEVLRLPEGSLAALLRPVATRRRRRPYPDAHVEALWDDAATAAAVQAHKRSGWDADLVRDFLRGPMRHPAGVLSNTGDGLRMAMRLGCRSWPLSS